MHPLPPHSLQPTAPAAANAVACYSVGEALRSRSVSDTVPSGLLTVPAPPPSLQADWQRDVHQQLQLEPGDVEPLPLPRARMRWPDYRLCVQAMQDWTRSLGLGEVLADSDIALMACRGARYHHDGVQYGASVFCNLFLGEDQGLDLHFPALDLRIPLHRGTAVVFDTGQPHAVVLRGSSRFEAAHFAARPDCVQVFLSWELDVEDPLVAHTLAVAFDTDPQSALPGARGQILVNGAAARVCPESGRWLPL